ncbi:Tobamovirus multiplication protein 1 [Nymphaea thermarum]|nr:Tobamovirus multiplication protein 1 [Nymphaea thermarum]
MSVARGLMNRTELSSWWVAEELVAAADWWTEINESTRWQDGIFYFLCAAYALVSSVALIQLIRIELRVPEYGWTTQKVFHFMNFIVNGLRAVVFGFHNQVFSFKPKASQNFNDSVEQNESFHVNSVTKGSSFPFPPVSSLRSAVLYSGQENQTGDMRAAATDRSLAKMLAFHGENPNRS